jgi:catechol 2,3-dioxygenase-like lactoylglutathione lyase family enzyme
MGAMTGRIWTIVVDCADADRAAEFWSVVLGLDIISRYEQYVFLGEVAPGVRMTLQEVPEEKLAKSRVHFDVRPDDHDTLVEKVVRLGGSVIARVDDDTYSLTVVADPDGNEFCINDHLFDSPPLTGE